LYLQGDISEKQGKGDASPHDRFVEGTAADLFQSGDAEERDGAWKKSQRDFSRYLESNQRTKRGVELLL
jgi:hypothetical protein